MSLPPSSDCQVTNLYFSEVLVIYLVANLGLRFSEILRVNLFLSVAPTIAL